MFNRISFVLAVGLLLAAAFLRLVKLPVLPSGLHQDEISDIRVTELVRQGRIEMFYDDAGAGGREGLYHITLAAFTGLVGKGSLGYRLLSVWTGLVGLALVYAIGGRLFGRPAGLSAMGLLAFSFWPALLSRQVMREAALPALVGGVLLALVVSLPTYRRRQRRGTNSTVSGALGTLIALGLYVHPAGLLVVLAVLVFVLFMAYSPQKMSRRRRRYVSFALLLTLILSIPYLTSSIRHPDLSGAGRLADDISSLSLGALTSSLGALVFTGASDARFNLPGRPLFDPVSVLLMAAGLVAAVRGWRQPRYALLLIMLAILAPMALFAPRGPDYLAFAPLLPILALLFGCGAAWAIKQAPQVPPAAAGLGMALLLLVNIVWTGRDLFSRWPESPEVQQAYQTPLGELAHYIDLTAHEVPTVICGWMSEQSLNTTPLTPAQIIDLLINRRSAPLRYADCMTGLVMTNGGAYQQVILPDPAVLRNAPWELQRWLAQGTPVARDDVPFGSILIMDVVQPLADQLGMFTVTTPLSYAPEVGGDHLIGPPIRFGGNVTFMGYVPEPDADYRPGSIVTLVTYWRVEGRVPRDLQIFAHILSDPGASPAANRDTISVAPRRLQNRDVFVQVTYIFLPDSIPPGEYRISIGVYQETSGIRLEVQQDGQPRGNRLFLYPITVHPPESSS